MQELPAIDPGFFQGGAVRVARRLLGARLAALDPAGGEAPVIGRIVETEAYLSRGDPASHSSPGPTRRNASMFGPPGHAYVYLIYGLHHCFNVVTGGEGRGEAVLVRALEPLTGLEVMARRRGRAAAHELCSGPAKLAQALAIGPQHDGLDLVRGELRILPPEERRRERVVAAKRVGIRKAADLPLRFYLAGNGFVSTTRP